MGGGGGLDILKGKIRMIVQNIQKFEKYRVL